MNPDMLAALSLVGGALGYALVSVVLSALAHRFSWGDADDRNFVASLWPIATVGIFVYVVVMGLVSIFELVALPFKALHWLIRTAGTGPKIPKAQVRQ